MQENIKQVIVKNTVRKEFKTAPIFQYDVGHVLSFEGFNLPEAFEVHFSLTESGDAVTQVGSEGEVAVPDILVQDGRELYAWLYISDEETGLTKFTIQIPVTRRAKPTDQVPTPVEQSEIQQAIAALNTGVARAETAAENAEQSEENASQYAENAYNSSEAAASAAESAEGDARTATEKAQIAVNAAETATRKAQEASESAEGLVEAVRTAQEAKQTAVNKATEAAQSATNAAQKAQEATSAASSASQSATDADTAKRAAETAMEAAQGYAGNASMMAQDANQSKNTAVEKAREASQSATDAAQSAQAAEQTAAQFEEDITQLKSDIESKPDIDDTAGEGDTDKTWSADKLVSELQDKADVIISSASGAIASFPDGAAAPVKKLVVNVEPKQDLHGQEAPYPPGGGKNKLPFLPNSSGSLGVTLTYDTENEAYVLNGTTNITGNIVLSHIPPNLLPISEDISTGTRILSVRVVSGSMTLGTGDGITYAVAIFNSSNNDYIRGGLNAVESQLNGYYGYRSTGIASTGDYFLYFQTWRPGTVFNNLKIRIQLEEASSTTALPTAWSPYSNFCHISGWTGTNVTMTGKNLFQKPYFEDGNKIVGIDVTTNDDGSITFNGTATSTFYYNFGSLGHNEKLFKAGTYTLSGGDALSSKFRIVVVKNGVYFTATSNKSITFTLPEDAMLYFYGTATNGSVFSNETYRPQLELDSATAYEPYSGQTIQVEFPSEAGTVYGCELTVNEDGTGSLVVDMAEVDMGTLEWDYASSGGRSIFTSHSLQGLYKNNGSNAFAQNVICECFKNVAMNVTFKNGELGLDGIVADRIAVCDNRYTDATTFKTAMDGIRLVYELATPLTYTLTAAQVTTLLGTNNVWSDAGDVEVTYRADTKLYIDNKLAELVAQIVNS